ncbi:hypothetical protein LQV63_27865 [Paenibacillus profundus]|uniref:Uncharacterized protein n=1 Tax=Paenibacillus profundus TaxID=1173085 RepID=A0ABS8YRW4_9BACL|nr:MULTISPECIES: hypothetical protein [Paenibacillus]MCE5173085.1 hypothetical protein [Paenibacillus profundus]
MKKIRIRVSILAIAVLLFVAPVTISAEGNIGKFFNASFGGEPSWQVR